jgi:hypothetical protein
MPWEFISPFCGLSAYGQGFHFIESTSNEEGIKDMSTTALVTVTSGQATARQIENEFKLKAGPNSSWRWFAKRVGEGKYQMRFPNVQTIEDLAHFTEMRMRSAPEVVIKIEKWNPITGSKGPLDVAWFRISNIPFEKRSYSNVCMVASKVGLPLEVDRDSLNKNDFVRVKIGCRDVTKVPASVDGVLDFHFYDYFFQREVPQDGFTDSSGTKWIRNERDQPKDDFPSPKKQKMEQSKQVGKFFEAGPSKNYGTDKGKQATGNDSGTGNQQHDVPEEDSEDESLLMGDLVVPGSEQLRFGNFEITELKKVVINEYGSNFMKYKQDPLVSIEAKKAIFDSKRDDIFQIDDVIGKSQLNMEKSIVVEDKEEEVIERAVSMSPIKDSQGGPEVDMSSQEERQQNVNQDIDWDLIQKEDEHEVVVNMIAGDTDHGKNSIKDSAQEDSANQDILVKETSQLEEMVETAQIDKVQGPVEKLNTWENQAIKLQAVMEQEQDVDKERWPTWQDVRQSKRIRANDSFQQKMGDQAASKNLQVMEDEGTLIIHQNSFAVLSNSHIIDLATKMGVQSESMSFEKIDLLKDLENARMKLVEHSSAPENQVINLEESNLPLEDQNTLDWGSDESEEEPLVLIASVRKSRSSKKGKKKVRASKKHPADVSVGTKGDKSKVSPRFNLRDRNTIKKIFP